MSRRTRAPGPIKEDAASLGRDFRNNFKSDWVSVNPVSGGALPTDVGDLTDDDIDNGVAGAWYYHDPNDVFDISGHGSDWVAADANGVEFYCDLAAMKETLMTSNAQASGKLSTALMWPNGTGQVYWNEMVGCTIEFLVESYENCPHDQNHDCGILVGVSNNKFLDSGETADGHHHSVGMFYTGDASTNADQLGVVHYNPQAGNTSLNAPTDCKRGWALFHFVQRDASNVMCAHHIALTIKSDGIITHQNNQTYGIQKSGDNMGMTEKAYLVVAPFARDNSGGGDAVRRTGKFKLWYRLLFSDDKFAPTYDPGTSNRQGS